MISATVFLYYCFINSKHWLQRLLLHLDAFQKLKEKNYKVHSSSSALVIPRMATVHHNCSNRDYRLKTIHLAGIFIMRKLLIQYLNTDLFLYSLQINPKYNERNYKNISAESSKPEGNLEVDAFITEDGNILYLTHKIILLYQLKVQAW